MRYLSQEERKALYKALACRDQEKADGRRSANKWREERGYPLLPEFEGYTDYLTPLVVLVLNTGLRRSEALGLRWSEVDLGDSPRIRVEAAITKSSKTRYVPLNAEALATLSRWRKACPSQHFVFPNPNTDLPMSSITSSWKRLMRRAGIVDCRFHDLRHDFASQLVMRGVDLYSVKELLGHSTIDVTQKYAHLSPRKLADAVAQLN